MRSLLSFLLPLFLSTQFLSAAPALALAHAEIVTWDKYSVLVNGERIILLSGEFHPFRLPSPGLWLDVFQKIRATGLFTAVSIYLDWALLEGKRGLIRTEGVFALDQFFDAAQQAGVYLIARPGPYINSETKDPDYLEAITPYIHATGRLIAKAQITNGRPVILFQPENEYTMCVNTTGYTQVNNMTITGIDSSCLQKEYMVYVQEEYRKAGIFVPFIINDAFQVGNFAPGSGVGAGDIYSFDSYPARWDGSPEDPSDWSELINPLHGMYNFTSHEQVSPHAPMAISEFQGGVPNPWGGQGVEGSAAFINAEFERIFYKLNYGLRIAIQNLGNLGHPDGYTSYDIGAAVAENRGVHREKYSELKLQASFLRASPDYLTSQPDNSTFGVYTDTNHVVVTRLSTTSSNFYIVRHSDLTSLESSPYKLRVHTSIGNLTIPQLGGSLSLNGRDSKIHVVDYNVGGIKLIYSTAEIFSWKKAHAKSVLVLYGGENELHEFGLPVHVGLPRETEGDGVVARRSKNAIIVQWNVEGSRRVLTFGNGLEIHLLWPNEAYNYWALDLPRGRQGLYAAPSRAQDSVIVKAGYLLRTAEISGRTLHLTGDVNATTPVEVISTPTVVSSIVFNGKRLSTTYKAGRLRYINSLPELDATYDSDWTHCNLTQSNNPRSLSTTTSLYASDYSYHAGSLLYRGTFTATSSESSIYLLTEGGFAYGHSVWLNSTYLGSWEGNPKTMFYNQTFPLSNPLKRGAKYTITVLIDHMGLDPRGILDYQLTGRDKSSITWKLTGNLGGEQYQDHTRGPLNEGALFAERQGYHLPGAPTRRWKKTSPTDSIPAPGVGFYVTEFDLFIPVGYDIPLSLFVNGWQFGKYINHIGPQYRHPIPEGILNYSGRNTLALTVSSQEAGVLELGALELSADMVVQSGYEKPDLVEGERIY
ncbi:beta-galactosidase [Aspergillus cavernicola]|uniref:beta-galactosidase n=1 Tax=Aspergillus cavernicola TaxID=176166 RepID=A0ABR4HKL0_9EURO